MHKFVINRSGLGLAIRRLILQVSVRRVLWVPFYWEYNTRRWIVLFMLGPLNIGVTKYWWYPTNKDVKK